MKEYQTPETEIITFSDVDVLTTSDKYSGKYSVPNDAGQTPII